MVQDSCWK